MSQYYGDLVIFTVVQFSDENGKQKVKKVQLHKEFGITEDAAREIVSQWHIANPVGRDYYSHFTIVIPM